jgi:hypothetical protein
MSPQPGPLEALPTRELLSRLVAESKALARAEVDLAKAELRADVMHELHMVEGFGVAAVCALCGFNLLLVALVFGLAQAGLPGWAGSLTVAGCMLVIGLVAGLIGWSVRAKKPLEKTQETLKEDLRWAKQRMA